MRSDILYLWNNIPLNTIKDSTQKNLELSSLDIEEALFIAHPQLSFCGVFQLIKNLPTTLTISEARMYANYGYALDSKLTELISRLPSLPEPFFKWCIEHNSSPRDLYPILSVKDLAPINEDLIHLHTIGVSRSLGSQILELLIECFLLDPNGAKTSAAHNGDEWLSQLKIKRYPQTYKSDLEKQQKMMSLPLPKDFQTRWQRQGDRSGLEVRFFISQEQELKKYSQLLQQTLENMSDKSHDAP